MVQSTRVPQAPLLLGLAGVVPFAWGAFALLMSGLADWAATRLTAGFAGLPGLNALFARWRLAPPWWLAQRLILTAPMLSCFILTVMA